MSILIRLILICVFAMSFQLSAQGPESVLENKTKDRLLGEIQQAIDRRAYVFGVDFSPWSEIVKKRQSAISKSANPLEFAAEINAALSEFGVSHFNLLTPLEALSRRTGNSTASGIRGATSKNGFEIHAVRRGSPAFVAKIRAGDLITAINGRTTSLPNDLDGKIAETKSFEIQRGTEKLNVNLEYREWKMPPDSLVWIEPDVALISVQSFTDANYSRNLMDTFFDQVKKARVLVIDLRGNGGGNASNVVHLAGKVLPNDTLLGAFVEKADAVRFSKAVPGRKASLQELAGQAAMIQRTQIGNAKNFSGDLLVITDRTNGSGAELFAFAVQEQNRAKIIGGKTRGKVLLGENIKLTAGFELQLVIADYITAKGQRIEGVGVEPDIKIDSGVLGDDAKLHDLIRQLTK